LGSFDNPRQRDARTEQVSFWPANVRFRVSVNAAQETININAFWLWLVSDWLVIHGDVVHDVPDIIAQIVFTVHLVEAVAHDVCNLVGESWVVVLHTGVGACQDW